VALSPTSSQGGAGSGTVTSVSSADTSITVATATTTPKLQLATLDVIATNEPPAASVPMNAHKLTGLANGSAATDSAAFGQLPAGTYLLFSSVLAVAAAAIDTGANGVAAGYSVLEVFILAQTADAAANANVIVTVNNDTGNNYDVQTNQANNATLAGQQSLARANWPFTLHGAGGSGTYPGVARFTIPGYAAATFWKVGEFTCGEPDATAADNIAQTGVIGYRETTAISRMKIAASSGANLAIGSALYIYGR
jgi:hypothetical protein